MRVVEISWEDGRYRATRQGQPPVSGRAATDAEAVERLLSLHYLSSGDKLLFESEPTERDRIRSLAEEHGLTLARRRT